MSQANNDSGNIHRVRIGNDSYQTLADLIHRVKTKDIFDPVTVIVPSQYCGVHIRRELSKDQGLLNVRFMTMPRLAECLGSAKLVQSGKSHLTPSVESAVISSIVSDSTEEDGPLSEIANYPGLPQLLVSTFRSFSKLRPEEVEQLRSFDSLSRQLTEWYDQYKRLTELYYSSEEAISAATESIRTQSASDVMRDLGMVIIYLPEELSSAQINLVRELLNSYEIEVVIGLVGEDDADLYSNKLANTLGCFSEAIVDAHKCDFRASHLVSASDMREEVKWIARDICRRSEEGMPFYRIAVAYQNDAYPALVHRQLAFAHIPAAGPDTRSYRNSAVGRSLTGILASIESDLSRKEIMKWLSECPARFPNNSYDENGRFAIWDFLSRSAGIVHGVDQWRDRLVILKSKFNAQISNINVEDELTETKVKHLTMMASEIDSLLEFIVTFSEVSKEKSFDTWSSAVDWIIKLLKLYSIPEELIPEHEALVLERLLRSIEEISALEQTGIPIDMLLFKRLIYDLLNGNSGARYGDTGSGVFVAPIGMLYGMDFDIVYFAGMCEGVVPRPMGVDPLLPVAITSAFGDPTISLSLKDFTDQQRKYFLSTVLSTKEHVLLYPRSDNISQSPSFPSPWFMDDVYACTGEQITSDRIPLLHKNDWITVISSPVDSLNIRDGLVPADIHDRDVSSIFGWSMAEQKAANHYLFNVVYDSDNLLGRSEARESVNLTEWDGDLSSASGVSSVLSTDVLSATGLESWAKCPFSYFLGHILGVESLNDPEEVMSISPLDKGTLVHSILERIVDTGVQLLPESDVDDHLVRICEDEFRLAEEKGVTGRSLFWLKAKSEILRDIRLFVANDGELIDANHMNTVWTEKPFGFDRENSLPPLAVELLDGTTMRFRGIIDRVDISQNRDSLSVIDYKTGSSNPYKGMDVDPLDAGRKLQLPIYGLVAREAFDNIDDVQSAYWFVSSSSNFERKSVDLASVESGFLGVLNLISDGIKAGLFPMNPGEMGRYGPENCTYCDFNRICPKERSVLSTVKGNDSRLRSYMELINSGNLDTGL